MIDSVNVKDLVKKDFFEKIRLSVEDNLDQNWDFLKKTWNKVKIDSTKSNDAIYPLNIKSNTFILINEFYNSLKNNSMNFEEFSDSILKERNKIFSGDNFSKRFSDIFGISFVEDLDDSKNYSTITSLVEILNGINNNSLVISSDKIKDIINCFGIELTDQTYTYAINSINNFVAKNDMKDLKENLLELLIFLRKSYSDYLKIPIYFDDFSEVLTWEKERVELETGNNIPNLFLNHIVFSPLNGDASNSLENLENELKKLIFNRVSESYKQYMISSYNSQFSFANFSSGKKKLSMFDDNAIKEKLQKVLVSQFLGMGMSLSDKERLAELFKETLLEK